MTKKERFEYIFLENVKREGAKELMNWLETTNFFVDPASTNYHGNYEGGLLEHSLNVYRELFPHTDPETAAICGLLHDICKADTYQQSFRNVKNDATGKWERVPCYIKKDPLPMGHGEKSAYLIQKYMQLTDREAMAIRWHMGFTDSAAKDSLRFVSEAFAYDPLVYELHAADMRASLKEEKR